MPNEPRQPQPETDLARLLDSLEPIARSGEYVVVGFTDGLPDGLAVEATISEVEGTTAVLTRSAADERNLEYGFVAGWITLHVFSALEAVGLTAVVATALAQQGISCNVLAGLHHDHLLVPIDRLDDAVGVLEARAALVDIARQLNLLDPNLRDPNLGDG